MILLCTRCYLTYNIINQNTTLMR